MSRPKVYLAGPITGLTFKEANAWRDRATFELGLEGIECLSPLRGKQHLAAAGPLPNDFDGGAEAVEQDLTDIRSSDALLVNFDGCEGISAGTMAEIGFAGAWYYHRDAPAVISVVPAGNPHDHVFVKYMSDLVVETLDDGIAAVLEVLGRG